MDVSLIVRLGILGILGNLVKFGNLGNLAIVAGAGAKFELGFANLQHLDLVIER